MNAYINIWGKKFLVLNVWWNSDRTIAHVSFYDDSGRFRTVHNDRYSIRLPNGVLYDEKNQLNINAKLGNIVTFEVV